MLVEDEIITQDEEDAIIRGLGAPGEKSDDEIESYLSELLEDGTISQSAYEAALDKLTASSEESEESRQNDINPLDNLVKSGTITKDQEDELIRALGNPKDNDDNSLETILSNMLENNIIDEDQYNEIINNL